MTKQEEQQILIESPAILGPILMDHGEQHALSEVVRLVDAAESAMHRADAAESALRLATGSKGSTTVVMSLDVYEKMLDLQALVERYGADQWRRGNAGREPQEFDEWQKEAQP